MNSKDIRRENLRALAKSIGGITKLAQTLNKSQSQISHLIGQNPIKNVGDRLAAQIEKVFNKSHGWLDHEHPELVKLLSIDNSLQKRGFNIEWVPLIQWQQVTYWLAQEENISSLVQEYLPVSFQISSKAFALKLQNDAIFTEIQCNPIHYLNIIVEPQQYPKQGDLVLASIGMDEVLSMRQFILENNVSKLKAVHGSAPWVEVDAKVKIIGVVRQIIIPLN